MSDDDLERFEAEGCAPLPTAEVQGHVEHEGARIWYAAYGAGPPVVLLHGGFGHGGNWCYQLPALVVAGYRVVLVDSRGHGRSTRDARPYSYELMATDVLAVMDTLGLGQAVLVGWSDGACVALTLAIAAPRRVAGVFFFACNMDPSGVKEAVEPSPLLDRCFSRHAKDYARLSATPEAFKGFVADVERMMKTQPNCPPEALAGIRTPVAVVQGEHEEFIRAEHAAYLAEVIPDAQLVILPGVSHFAPLQRPVLFNAAVLGFLRRALP